MQGGRASGGGWGGAKGGLRRRRSRPRRYFDISINFNECHQRRRKADRPEDRRVLARSTGVSARRSRSALRGQGSREAGEGLADDPAPRNRRAKEGVEDRGSGRRRHLRHAPTRSTEWRWQRRTRSSRRRIAIQHCAERTRLRRRVGRGEGRPDAPTFAPEAIF